MQKIFIAVFISIISLTGCASQRTVALQPEPVMLLSPYPAQRVDDKTQKEKADSLSMQQSGVMTLPKALSLALVHNPQLAVFSYETRILESNALQAALIPNPVIEGEIENFAGSGSFSGLGGAETTLSLGQLIELGGKRKKRANAAIIGADVAALDYESARLDVFTKVVKSFVNLVALQQQTSLQEEMVQLAKDFADTIHRRVAAGRVSPAEKARATVELNLAIIEFEKQKKELHAARQQLASIWGSKKAMFGKVSGQMNAVERLPDITAMQQLLEQNPDAARWAVALLQRDAEWEFEKAQRIPNLMIAGGYRRLGETRDNAFVVGLSLPLTLFDRNQGNIQAAELERLQAEQQKEAVEISLNNRLLQIYDRLSSAVLEVNSLESGVIPEAQKAYDMINNGYKMGKFGFLDILDAQRSLFHVRSSYYTALQEYHHSLADIERLIGRSINDIQ